MNVTPRIAVSAASAKISDAVTAGRNRHSDPRSRSPVSALLNGTLRSAANSPSWRGLAVQPTLDVPDARLEQRDLFLERRQAALEDLAPAALVG